MVFANAKKTFDKFFARFTTAIAPLDFTDCYKISNLRKTLSERLCFKMADTTIYTSFGQYVSRCHQCDLDLCQANGFRIKIRTIKTNQVILFPKTKGARREIQ